MRDNRAAASPSRGLRMALADELSSLAPAQRRLARYLLDHFGSASDLTITELAEESGVSVGTVSQLIRRFGLRGYHDLRLHARARGRPRRAGGRCRPGPGARRRA